MADVSSSDVWQIVCIVIQINGKYETGRSNDLDLFTHLYSWRFMASDQSVKVKFPLWPFLNQPLFHPTFRVMLNPARFQYAYQLRLLERCLLKKSPRISSDNSPHR